MNKIITTIVITLVFLSTYVATTKAQAPDRSLNEYSVQELVSHFATQYQVSEKQMLATIHCESSGNAAAVGDGGHSFGLSQIYLPANPTVTREQALDKVYAVEFMAREFKLSHQRKWTCWRTLFM